MMVCPQRFRHEDTIHLYLNLTVNNYHTQIK